MSTIYSLQHNILHNELNKNGWSLDNNINNNNNKKFIYKIKHANNINQYDEFVLDYISSYELAITVPIPCSSISYRNTFKQKDIQGIQEYLKMHLSNYKC